MRRMFTESLPISLTKASRAAMLGFDIIWLGLFATPAAVGNYGASRRFVGVGTLIVGLLYTTFLPRLIRVQSASLTGGRRLVRLARWRATAALVPLALIGVLLAPWATQLLLGVDFAPAGRILQILGWTVVLAGIAGPSQETLLSQGLETTLLKLAAVAAVTVILLDVALIPAYGAMGAAVAAVIGEAVRLALLTRAANRALAPISGP